MTGQELKWTATLRSAPPAKPLWMRWVWSGTERGVSKWVWLRGALVCGGVVSYRQFVGVAVKVVECIQVGVAKRYSNEVLWLLELCSVKQLHSSSPKDCQYIGNFFHRMARETTPPPILGGKGVEYLYVFHPQC